MDVHGFEAGANVEAPGGSRGWGRLSVVAWMDTAASQRPRRSDWIVLSSLVVAGTGTCEPFFWNAHDPMAGSSTLVADSRSCVDRQHLSLVASMPSGDVADLIELEGSPSSDAWVTRSARLSDAALSRLELPIGCRIRLWVIRKALAYWKVRPGMSRSRYPLPS